jgi:hypothetical protein
MRYVTNLTWAEAPHLSEAEQAELLASIPPYQRKARTKGIPILGSGVIYPFDEAQITVAPFDIPVHWPRCFGLDSDAGAGFTAIVWLALDRDNQCVYVTKDYKSPSRSKADHVEALRAVGQRVAKHKPLWIPGVGDAKGLLVTEKDSIQVIQLYQESGVDIEHPDKAVEAGIQDIYDLIQVGRFKVFATCTEFFHEFRQYHRVDGKIVKKNDHLLDACRYAVRSGLARAKTPPPPPDDVPPVLLVDQGGGGLGWMGM